MSRKLVAAVVGVLLVSGYTAHASVNPAALCREKKSRATGKKAFDLLKAFGKNVKKEDPARLDSAISKAESKFTKEFTRAEAHGDCLTSDDSASIEAKVEAFIVTVISDVCLVTTTTTTSATTTTSTTSLPRASEPIVVSGADLTALLGTVPEEVFVFRFESGAGWQQIPHQVDERRMTELWAGAPCPAGCELRYVFSGTEGNGLDEDDEVVFMARDVGGIASGSHPAGVSGPGYEVAVMVPGQGTAGYAYVFASSGLMKDFGPPLVSYTRTPIDADTEDTDIVTPHYHLHFSRLWVIDAIEVLPGGGGDGLDLLDRWKGRAGSLSALSGETEDVVGVCGGWSNHDPDWGVHTYLGHINGPVRAIRSLQGACSYRNLTRVDVFYRGMAQLILNIRGHAMNDLYGYWDYSQAASPMVYYNPMVPDGTIIDGLNDPGYPNGDLAPDISEGWEQVDSAHGGIAFTFQETIDLPGSIKAFIWDDVGYDDGTGEDPLGNPGVIGGNGQHIPWAENTDPATGGTPAQIVLHYWPLPANSGKVGDSYAAVALNPSTITVNPY